MDYYLNRAKGEVHMPIKDKDSNTATFIKFLNNAIHSGMSKDALKIHFTEFVDMGLQNYVKDLLKPPGKCEKCGSYKLYFQNKFILGLPTQNLKKYPYLCKCYNTLTQNIVVNRSDCINILNNLTSGNTLSRYIYRILSRDYCKDDTPAVSFIEYMLSKALHKQLEDIISTLLFSGVNVAKYDDRSVIQESVRGNLNHINRLRRLGYTSLLYVNDILVHQGLTFMKERDHPLIIEEIYGLRTCPLLSKYLIKQKQRQNLPPKI